MRVTRNLRRNWSVVITKRKFKSSSLHSNPSKRLKKDTGTQANNSAFIFIADKVFGFPVIQKIIYVYFIFSNTSLKIYNRLKNL